MKILITILSLFIFSLAYSQPVFELSNNQRTQTTITANPDISAIADFRSHFNSNNNQEFETYFKQLEIQLSSVVDPYARANFIFALGKDLPSDPFEASLEIATLTTTSLPYGLELTVGKFKPHFSKVNQIHPHAFSFINYPLMIQSYFGDEGLFMEGFSGSWLIPNPLDFYQELQLEIGQTTQGNTLAYGSNNHLLLIAHLKNFFDLTDNSTLELGLSALSGPDSLNHNNNMLGFDLTYKWKPVQYNTYQSFLWQSEAMTSHSTAVDNTSYQSYGAYTLLEYQLAQRWFLGTRLDYSEKAKERNLTTRATSLLFKFQPTEFQILAFEFQRYNNSFGTIDQTYNQVLFRLIFGIGTHASHPY